MSDWRNESCMNLVQNWNMQLIGSTSFSWDNTIMVRKKVLWTLDTEQGVYIWMANNKMKEKKNNEDLTESTSR